VFLHLGASLSEIQNNRFDSISIARLIAEFEFEVAVFDDELEDRA
jgi:hypothetical protein